MRSGYGKWFIGYNWVMEPLGNKGQMPEGREIGIMVTKQILSLKGLGED